MKQKLKEGDVVMILPHELYWTEKFIDEIGVVKHKFANFILIHLGDVGEVAWAFDDSAALKIGTL